MTGIKGPEQSTPQLVKLQRIIIECKTLGGMFVMVKRPDQRRWSPQKPPIPQGENLEAWTCSKIIIFSS